MSPRTSVVVTWDAKTNKPLSHIIIDEEPCFDLSVFDYSGSLDDNHKLLMTSEEWSHELKVRSTRTEGKGDIFRVVSEIPEAANEGYIAIIDDDVLIRVSDINRAITIGTAANLASFQPSLAKCSHYSHSFTLNQPGADMRHVDWVEVMMPFIKCRLLQSARPLLGKSISSWGLDCYAFPMLAAIENIGTSHAVIDASIAAHVRPITSGNKVYRNGLTAQQEKAMIKEACQKYLRDRSIDWEQSEELHRLFAFQ